MYFRYIMKYISLAAYAKYVNWLVGIFIIH